MFVIKFQQTRDFKRRDLWSEIKFIASKFIRLTNEKVEISLEQAAAILLFPNEVGMCGCVSYMKLFGF